MGRLVLHVGPAKCGSSSIQVFLAGHEKHYGHHIRYRLLAPMDIRGLSHDEPGEAAVARVAQLMSALLPECEVLILSHEYLFQNPRAVGHLCLLAKRLGADTTVVGYSRRQSAFLRSAYAQWLFRSPERIRETTEVVKSLGLDPLLFSGLERQLIASVADDFFSARQLDGSSILDWENAYAALADQVHGSGAVIRCGVLPMQESGTTLIRDFCQKAGLGLEDDLKNSQQCVANPSFAADVVEAINNAVAFGHAMPGPHEDNEVIERISAAMPKLPDDETGFLATLDAYIDASFWPSNGRFCRRFDLDEAYFAVPAECPKSTIMAAIADQGRRRAADPIAVVERYRRLTAASMAICLQREPR